MDAKAVADTTHSFSADRLASLNDGVFAVAMTLLAYNVHLPHGPLSDRELRAQLGATEHDLRALCLSFAVAAMFWRGHINLLNTMRQSGRLLVSPTLVFLFFVVLLPITTNLYGTFGATRTTVPLYVGNLGVLALIQLALWIVALTGLPLSRKQRLLRLVPSLYVSTIFLLAILISFFNPAAAMTACIAAFISPLVVRLTQETGATRAQADHAPPPPA